jgi:hypothetical protein
MILSHFLAHEARAGGEFDCKFEITRISRSNLSDQKSRPPHGSFPAMNRQLRS